MSYSLRPHGLCSPWNSPGQNTGVGSLFLLKGIFPTQRLNPGLLHCRHILNQLNHKGNPRILEWVAYPLSRGSAWSRNWTGVSCITSDSLPTELSEKPRITIQILKKELYVKYHLFYNLGKLNYQSQTIGLLSTFIPCTCLVHVFRFAWELSEITFFWFQKAPLNIETTFSTC